jgi:hypothetical protein
MPDEGRPIATRHARLEHVESAIALSDEEVVSNPNAQRVALNRWLHRMFDSLGPFWKDGMRMEEAVFDAVCADGPQNLRLNGPRPEPKETPPRAEVVT